MAKHKLDITKNHLSWEKTQFKKCDNNDCQEKGEFKAPKSRLMLNQYYFFCLKHIKEYNKSWDFYKGLSVSQIEFSMREDTIWNRPSWPLKGNPYKIINQINEFFSDEFDEFNPKEEKNKFFQNKLFDENLTSEENRALTILKLNLPITLEKIKKNYKKLVKIFHPDVNGNNKIAEEKFKEINQSYRTLLQKFKNEQKV
ncbi:J domain-containing protein [Pelagibacteraceae bacterium]|nr:J domain-containing protein [Pelagibacteraceae bacterium]